MTAQILPFPRPHLRFVEAVQRARYVADATDGYSPKVLPIPPQKLRINCASPVPVLSSNFQEQSP